MKQKMEPRKNSTLIKQVLLGLIVFLGFSCLYYGSFLAPYSPRLDEDSSAAEDSVDPILGSLVLKEDGSGDRFQPQELDSLVPKSIPLPIPVRIAVEAVGVVLAYDARKLLTVVVTCPRNVLGCPDMILKVRELR